VQAHRTDTTAAEPGEDEAELRAELAREREEEERDPQELIQEASVTVQHLQHSWEKERREEALQLVKKLEQEYGFALSQDDVDSLMIGSFRTAAANGDGSGGIAASTTLPELEDADAIPVSSVTAAEAAAGPELNANDAAFEESARELEKVRELRCRIEKQCGQQLTATAAGIDSSPVRPESAIQDVRLVHLRQQVQHLKQAGERKMLSQEWGNRQQ